MTLITAMNYEYQPQVRESFADIGRRYNTPEHTYDNPIFMHYVDRWSNGVKYDGSDMMVIETIQRHESDHYSSRYLDEPAYNNLLINSGDCNPEFIRAFAKGVHDGYLDYVPELKEDLAGKVSALFEHGATPRTLVADYSKDDMVFVFKDDAEPDAYRITSGIFYESMSFKKILAFDIHDLVQHPIQLKRWPNQFCDMAKFAFQSYNLPNSKERDRLVKLSQLIWLATFEESLIDRGNGMFSFGCLNWLAPSETPYEQVDDINMLNTDDLRVAYKWHSVDALKDMYRIELSSKKEIGDESITWLSKLGYTLDPWLIHLSESSDKKPLLPLDFYACESMQIAAPSTPEELFSNAYQLIEEELRNANF